MQFIVGKRARTSAVDQVIDLTADLCTWSLSWPASSAHTTACLTLSLLLSFGLLSLDANLGAASHSTRTSCSRIATARRWGWGQRWCPRDCRASLADPTACVAKKVSFARAGAATRRGDHQACRQEHHMPHLSRPGTLFMIATRTCLVCLNHLNPPCRFASWRARSAATFFVWYVSRAL